MRKLTTFCRETARDARHGVESWRVLVSTGIVAFIAAVAQQIMMGA